MATALIKPAVFLPALFRCGVAASSHCPAFCSRRSPLCNPSKISRQVMESSTNPTPVNPSNNNDAQSKNEFNSFIPEELGAGATYGLCISAVVPRPVAVISSISNDGIVNVAPFSYSGLLTHDPPIVSHGIVVSQRSGKKDTLNNIEANQHWVFNILSKHYLEKANQCAASLPPEEDEAQVAGLETLSSDIVLPPRLKDALVSMECKLYDKKEIFNDSGVHTTTIVFGRVVKFHLHSSVMKEGSTMEKPLVDLEKLQAVGRAGDITYWPVGTSADTVKAIVRPK